MDCINSIAHVSSFQSRVRSLYDLCYNNIVRYGHLELVKYLTEVQGCSTECTDRWKRTPLHDACW